MDWTVKSKDCYYGPHHSQSMKLATTDTRSREFIARAKGAIEDRLSNIFAKTNRDGMDYRDFNKPLQHTAPTNTISLQHFGLDRPLSINNNAKDCWYPQTKSKEKPSEVLGNIERDWSGNPKRESMRDQGYNKPPTYMSGVNAIYQDPMESMSSKHNILGNLEKDWPVQAKRDTMHNQGYNKPSPYMSGVNTLYQDPMENMSSKHNILGNLEKDWPVQAKRDSVCDQGYNKPLPHIADTNTVYYQDPMEMMSSKHELLGNLEKDWPVQAKREDVHAPSLYEPFPHLASADIRSPDPMYMTNRQSFVSSPLGDIEQYWPDQTERDVRDHDQYEPFPQIPTYNMPGGAVTTMEGMRYIEDGFLPKSDIAGSPYKRVDTDSHFDDYVTVKQELQSDRAPTVNTDRFKADTKSVPSWMTTTGYSDTNHDMFASESKAITNKGSSTYSSTYKATKPVPSWLTSTDCSGTNLDKSASESKAGVNKEFSAYSSTYATRPVPSWLTSTDCSVTNLDKSASESKAVVNKGPSAYSSTYKATKPVPSWLTSTDCSGTNLGKSASESKTGVNKGPSAYSSTYHGMIKPDPSWLTTTSRTDTKLRISASDSKAVMKTELQKGISMGGCDQMPSDKEQCLRKLALTASISSIVDRETTYEYTPTWRVGDGRGPARSKPPPAVKIATKLEKPSNYPINKDIGTSCPQKDKPYIDVEEVHKPTDKVYDTAYSRPDTSATGDAYSRPDTSATGEVYDTACSRPDTSATGEVYGTAHSRPGTSATGEVYGTAHSRPGTSATGEVYDTAYSRPDTSATGDASLPLPPSVHEEVQKCCEIPNIAEEISTSLMGHQVCDIEYTSRDSDDITQLQDDIAQLQEHSAKTNVHRHDEDVEETKPMSPPQTRHILEPSDNIECGTTSDMVKQAELKQTNGNQRNEQEPKTDCDRKTRDAAANQTDVIKDQEKTEPTADKAVESLSGEANTNPVNIAMLGQKSSNETDAHSTVKTGHTEALSISVHGNVAQGRCDMKKKATKKRLVLSSLAVAIGEQKSPEKDEPSTEEMKQADVSSRFVPGDILHHGYTQKRHVLSSNAVEMTGQKRSEKDKQSTKEKRKTGVRSNIVPGDASHCRSNMKNDVTQANVGYEMETKVALQTETIQRGHIHADKSEQSMQHEQDVHGLETATAIHLRNTGDDIENENKSNLKRSPRQTQAITLQENQDNQSGRYERNIQKSKPANHIDVARVQMLIDNALNNRQEPVIEDKTTLNNRQEPVIEDKTNLNNNDTNKDFLKAVNSLVDIVADLLHDRKTNRRDDIPVSSLIDIAANLLNDIATTRYDNTPVGSFVDIVANILHDRKTNKRDDTSVNSFVDSVANIPKNRTISKYDDISTVSIHDRSFKRNDNEYEAKQTKSNESNQLRSKKTKSRQNIKSGSTSTGTLTDYCGLKGVYKGDCQVPKPYTDIPDIRNNSINNIKCNRCANIPHDIASGQCEQCNELTQMIECFNERWNRYGVGTCAIKPEGDLTVKYRTMDEQYQGASVFKYLKLDLPMNTKPVHRLYAEATKAMPPNYFDGKPVVSTKGKPRRNVAEERRVYRNKIYWEEKARAAKMATATAVSLEEFDTGQLDCNEHIEVAPRDEEEEEEEVVKGCFGCYRENKLVRLFRRVKAYFA